MTGVIPANNGHGHNKCPAHPEEEIIGLCGCGTFFCCHCSPSAIFCGRCYDKRQQRASHARARVAAIDPGWMKPADGGHDSSRHSFSSRLSNRIITEALVLTILTFAVLGLALAMKGQVLSYAAAQQSISYGINSGSEPLQQQTQPLKFSEEIDNDLVTISSDTTYSISAKVESVRSYDDSISSVIPYDLLLAWGDVAQNNVDSKLHWSQQDRRGTVSGTLGGDGARDLTNDYVISHVSNNHIVPANDHIKAALAGIKPGDKVKIDGYLVDVKVQKPDRLSITVKTSKSRTDQGDGACEIILAEQIKINGNVFK